MALTVASAFTWATSDALTKKALADVPEQYAAWARIIYTIPFFFPLMLMEGMRYPGAKFWAAVAIAVPLEVGANWLYARALKASPLSLTLPFLSFTPVFLIFVSYFLLGETVTPVGGFGIGLIALGGYVLNLHEARSGFFGPVRAAFREKGSLMMIAASLIFAFTSALGKLGVNESSPVFFGGVYFLAMGGAFAPFAIGKKALPAIGPRGDFRLLRIMFWPGIFNALMAVTHFYAISMTEAAYMMAVKRTNLMFGIFYGWFMFREEKIGERASGALLMLGGVALIAFFG